jgi:hypothetical protein
MTESNLKLGAQNTAKMHELIAGMCVVTFKEEGDRRGMIEHIESLMGSGVSGLYPPSFGRWRRLKPNFSRKLLIK